LSQNIPADKTLRKGTCLVCGEDFFDEKICPNDGTMLQQIKEDANVGSILAERFEIIAALGKGGMSTVYKGRHLLMDRIVAIKLLTASDVQSLKRFQMEAKLACNLSHHNIVTVFDFGVSTLGQPYLVMDYLQGMCLSDMIKAEGPMPVERALSIFIQACDALSYAHKKDVVHRDLKPSNFMILQQEDEEVLKLVDFGIAKQLNTETQEGLSLTRTGEVLGSPLYMSPEQCLGQKLDQRADIYSLGCVMFEVLTGFPPLMGTNALDILHKHINEDPPPFRVINPGLRELPPGLEKVVFRALDRNRDTRYQTMLDLWTELEVLSHATKRQSSAQNKALQSPGQRAGEPTGSVHSLAQEWIQRPSGSKHPELAPPLLSGPLAAKAAGASQLAGQQSAETSEHSVVDDVVQAVSGNVGPAKISSMPAQPGRAPQAEASASWQIPSVDNKNVPPHVASKAKYVDSAAPSAIPQSRSDLNAGPEEAQAHPPQAAASGSARADSPSRAASANAQVNSATSTAPPQVPASSSTSAASPQARANSSTSAASPQARANSSTSAASPQVPASSSTSAASPRAQASSGTSAALANAQADAARSALQKNVLIGLLVAAVLTILGVGGYFLNAHLASPAVAPITTNKSNSAWESDVKAGEDAYQKAHYDQAVENFQGAVKQARSFAENDPRLASSLNNLGNAFFKLDQYPDAEQALTEALKIRSVGQENAAMADSMTDLAMVYCAQGHLDKAEHLLNRGLSIRKRKCGVKSEEVADSLASLAALYNKQGRVGEAMKYLNQCLEIRSAEKNPRPADLAATENSIATDYQMQHKLPQARLWFERAKNHAEAALGPDHPLVSDSLVGLASVDFLQNRYVEAEQLFNRAREIRDAAYGRENLRTAEVLACLAILKEQQGKYAEAKPLLFKALSIKKEVLGDSNPEVMRTTENYNDLLKHLRR
jgi:eukaryotic-like serine/threonine-protein kinase